AVAVGGTAGQRHPLSFAANFSAPAQLFPAVHGETAVLTDAVTGAVLPGPAPTVSVDLLRHQITVTVSHSEWNPGTSVVRLAAGVGLWNSAANRYLLPRAQANETEPGGAGAIPNPPAFLDAAFRLNPHAPI